MDNQDQRTHTQGHENHGVHVCNKCGWPFPNPHPSAKLRRAHKKICGTIEGYTLLISESQTHFNPSDDEHYSDDDRKRQGPKALEADGKNEIGNGGIGENTIRSVDEVFSDAVADFSDGALSPGVKESLRDSLDFATGLYPELSGSSEDNGCNDENHLIVKSRHDGQMQNPKIVQSERVEDGNMLELQGQLSTSTLNSLTSSIEDLKTEELTAVHTNDFFDLRSDSNPSKSEAMSDVLLDNKIYAGEDDRASNFTSVAKETVLKENDEIKSDKDLVKIVVSPECTRGETVEGVSKIAISYGVKSDYQVDDGDFNLKRKAEFPIMMPHDGFPLDMDSAVSTNASISVTRVQSEHMIELAISRYAKTLQESEERNVHILSHPSCDDRPDVAHPRINYEDCHINNSDQGVVSLNSSSLHSKALEQERDDLEDSDTEENDFLINLGQLSERREVLSQDMHALNGDMKKEQMNCELMAEESIEVFPVTFKNESSKSLDENRASMDAMKTEMNISENHIVNFSKEGGSDVHKNSQHVNSPESSFMAASNENQSDTSFGSAASESSTVISRDNRSHHEKNITGKNDKGTDGKCSGAANWTNYTGISMESLLPSNMHSEIKPPRLYNIEDAVEMGKFENCDIKDSQYTERSFGKDNPSSATSHFESPIPSQEDIKDGETDGSGRLNENCNRFLGTTADSYQDQDGELLLNSTEGLGRDHSWCSLNIEPSAQHVSAAKNTEDGEASRKVPGVVADPIQDQNVLSVQSDGQAVSDSQALPSTDSLTPTEASRSNLNDPKAPAYERQQSEHAEMFEPPSFMTLVESGLMVGKKTVDSEVQTESNKQHPDLTTASQAGWFPTLTHITNGSQGRKRNEKIIAKVTKQNMPLKSLLSDAANCSKPSKPEKNSVIRKNGKVSEENGSGLTTVNSILGCESPAVQVVKEDSAEEWNSRTSYASEIKRKKKKSKSKPFWIQFMCCSSVETKSR